MSESSRKNTSLTNQSAWILFAKFVGFALSTMLPLLVVRYLSQENVGIYRQAFLVVANAILVLPLGFSMSAYYFLNRDPEKHSATVFNILIFNFLIGGLAFVVLVLFPQILGSTFQSPELSRLAPLIGLVIWLGIFSGFLETAALALQEARLAATFIVLSQLLKTALMIAALLVFQTVDSLVYATLMLFALQSIFLVAFLHRRFPRFWIGFDSQFFLQQMAYALPFGLSVLLYVGQTDIHNYFVSHSFSAAEFAIYSVGCFQLPLITLLYESVGAVMIPRMSQMQDEGRKREMLEMTVNATQRLAFVYFPLFAFLMIVASEFITTLFTKEYSASATIFRVNLFALPLFSLVVDPIVRAYPAASRLLLKVRIAIFAGLLAVFWLGVGKLGLTEMIAIVVAAILFEKLIAAWISARMLEVKSADFRLLKTVGYIAVAALAAAVVLGVVYLLAARILMDVVSAASENLLSMFGIGRGIEFVAGCIFLAICSVLYAGAYLIAANWLGVIEPADKERFYALVRRVSFRRFVEHKAA